MSKLIESKLDLIHEKISTIANVCEELKTEQKNQTLILNEHDVKLAEYNSELTRHIEGVEQNREGIRAVKEELDDHKYQSNENYASLEASIKKDMEPYEKLRITFSVIWKMVVGLGILAGIVVTILKF